MSSEAPPPARRILPDVPISEQGLRQLEIWLLGTARSLIKRVPTPDLSQYLHWGTNTDTDSLGLTLNAQEDVLVDADSHQILLQRESSATTGGFLLMDENDTVQLRSGTQLNQVARFVLDGTGVDHNWHSDDGSITIEAENDNIQITADTRLDVDADDILVSQHGSSGDYTMEADGELHVNSDDQVAIGAPLFSVQVAANHIFEMGLTAGRTRFDFPAGGSLIVRDNAFATIFKITESIGLTTASLDGGSP